MKKNLSALAVFVLLLAVACIKTYAQSEPSNYKVVMRKFQQYYNDNQPDSLFTLFAPEVKAVITAEKSKQMVSTLQTQYGMMRQLNYINTDNGIAIYKASFDKIALAVKVNLNEKNLLRGLFFDNYKDANQGGSTDNKTANVDASLGESAYTYKKASVTIAGTLTIPANVSGKVPVVLIIAGSGPTDRNGNNLAAGLNTNTYKMLAQGLSKSGIASLRYDKRLVGESKSATKESQMRIDNYIDDAVGMINQLHDDARFSKIIVLGHSEGSLIGMVSAVDQPANAFISVSGSGRPAYDLLNDQMKSQPEYIATKFKAILDSLRRGKIQDNVDAPLYPFARPSVQPYLMSWMAYDPPRVLKQLKIPVLIVQGNTDLQVKVLDAEKLKKGKSDAVLQIIPNMNHILKEAPEDRDKNLATYNNPDLPLKPELMPAIVDFIKKLK